MADTKVLTVSHLARRVRSFKSHPASPVNISESFTSQKFAAALEHLKPGKSPGSDSICPELKTHAGAALKSWLCGFLPAPPQNFKRLEKSTGSGDP